MALPAIHINSSDVIKRIVEIDCPGEALTSPAEFYVEQSGPHVRSAEIVKIKPGSTFTAAACGALALVTAASIHWLRSIPVVGTIVDCLGLAQSVPSWVHSLVVAPLGEEGFKRLLRRRWWKVFSTGLIIWIECYMLSRTPVDLTWLETSANPEIQRLYKRITASPENLETYLSAEIFRSVATYLLTTGAMHVVAARTSYKTGVLIHFGWNLMATVAQIVTARFLATLQ